jgi:hypothetical protein
LFVFIAWLLNEKQGDMIAAHAPAAEKKAVP